MDDISIQDLKAILSDNTKTIESLSQQLNTALNEITRLKSLIGAFHEIRTEEDVPEEIDIMKLRQEIQDSFRNLKKDYEMELTSDRKTMRYEKYKSKMEVIEEQIENTTLKEIKLPRNQEELNNRCMKTKKKIPLANGLIYEGETVGGKIEGFGIVMKGQEELYVGSFKDGLFHGQGRLTRNEYLPVDACLPFPTWLSYNGQFTHGLFNGMGTLIISRKEKYLGRFKKGRIQGQGVYYSSGDIELGKWEKNKFHSLL